MQATSLYLQLILVWIHRLTGSLLIVGAGTIGFLSFLHWIGAEFDTVSETWFGFSPTDNTFVFWLHMNSGLATILALFIVIIGSKLMIDAPPRISRLTDEHIVAKNAEATRYALLDMMQQLQESLLQTAKTADAAQQLNAYRKRLVARIGQVLESMGNIDPKQLPILEPEQIVQAHGFLTYVNHQIQQDALRCEELAAVLSDLETAIRLTEKTRAENVSRQTELQERLTIAVRRAYELGNMHDKQTKVVQIQKPAE